MSIVLIASGGLSPTGPILLIIALLFFAFNAYELKWGNKFLSEYERGESDVLQDYKQGSEKIKKQLNK
jgi:hypothetical protein